MITNFKIFENIKENEGKFLVIPSKFRNYYVYLIEEIKKLQKEDKDIQLNGFYFNVIWDHKNLTSLLQSSEFSGEYYKKDFDEFNFLTPREFYDNYTEICTCIYKKILIDEKKSNWSEWYGELLKILKNRFKNITELEQLEAIEKYNL